MAVFEYFGYSYIPTSLSPSGNMHYACNLVGICYATGKKSRLGRFTLIRPHVHRTPGDVFDGDYLNSCFIEMYLFKEKLKERAAGRGKFKDIYAVTKAEYPNGANFCTEFSAMSLMNRIRIAGLPVQPTTFIDLHQLFFDDELCRFSINNEFIYSGYALDIHGNCSPFFTCNELLQLVMECHPTIMYIDSSFKMVPMRPKSKQLLSVHFQINNNSFPVIFCLMGDNGLATYYSVIFYINRCILPNYCPQTIYTDLNSWLIHPLKSYFKDANIYFSWFNYNQNLYDKMIDFGYSNILINCEITMKCFKMLLLLPLLPSNDIENGFNEVKSYAAEENIDIYKIFDFFTSYWLQKIGTNEGSLYRKPDRTLNNIEIFHEKLFGSFNNCYPTIWTFLSSIVNFSKIYLQAAHQLDTDRNYSNNTIRCQLKYNSPNIEQNTSRLVTGEITVKEFLLNCSGILDNYEAYLKDYTKKMAIHNQDQHYFKIDIEDDDDSSDNDSDLPLQEE